VADDPSTSEVDLVEIGRQAVLEIIERALEGQLLPGLLWSAEQVAQLEDGSLRVHFAVFGDLATAVPLLDLPEEIQDLVLDEVEILVRGRITLTLERAAFAGLQRTFGHVPEADDDDAPPDRALLEAYGQGLDMTARALDDMEKKAVVMAREARDRVLVEIAAFGLDPEVHGAELVSIFGLQCSRLRLRMDERRGRLADLLGDLHDVGSMPRSEAASQLERILGEEYATMSEAEADLASLGKIVRFALSESAEKLTR
jgi:hypothetical protein